MAALLRRNEDYSVGPVIFDVDVSVQREIRATLSEERLADGTHASEHAEVEPEEFTIVMAKSNVSGASDLAGRAREAATGLSQTLGAPASENLNTRRRDAERDLKAVVRALEEVDVVTSEGTLRVFVTGVSAVNDFSTFDAYVATIRAREVLRASTTRTDLPSDLSDALSGSGTGTDLGPTQLGDATEVTLGL